MAKIGRLWAGKLFGTNTGNIAAEFDADEAEFKGTIRLMDDRFGPIVYDVKGTFDGSIVELSGQPSQPPPDVQLGSISAKATLTPNGELRGEWLSSLRTGGPFVLFPHDTEAALQQTTDSLLPEQLHVATRTLGAIRLYQDDVQELIAFLQRDFAQRQRVIITYFERGNEISKYSSDFLKSAIHTEKLRYLKLIIQEPEAYGINRHVQVELNANGSNTVRVQGVQESWVIGKAETIASQLRTHEKTLVTTFRRYGLNVNAILFLAALVLLPELPLVRRIVFIFVLVCVLAAIVSLHSRFIPNVAIHLSRDKPGYIAQAWPQILSWLIAASAALFAAVAYGILSGELFQ